MFMACLIIFILKFRGSSPYKALLATGDGNCFYNSISTLLFGHEDHSLHLRLASVVHAVSHVDHYIEMVCSPK